MGKGLYDLTEHFILSKNSERYSIATQTLSLHKKKKEKSY